MQQILRSNCLLASCMQQNDHCDQVDMIQASQRCKHELLEVVHKTKGSDCGRRLYVIYAGASASGRGSGEYQVWSSRDEGWPDAQP